MGKRGLARLDELDELARAHGWLVERYIPDADDLPPGCVEAHGWMANKTLADGRDFNVIIVYGRAEGGGWSLLRDEGKYPVTCCVDEPTITEPVADMTIRFEAVWDIEHWIPRIEDLIALWKEEGTYVERKTASQRQRDALRRRHERRTRGD